MDNTAYVLQAPGYIVGTFIFTYATTVLGAPRNFVLMAVLVQAVLGFLWVPVAGHLSDRIGRKRMYIIGSVLVGIFGFIYFGLLDTKVPSLMFIAIALSLLPMMTCYGPQAAMIAESFTPRLRYSGSSLGYQLASIIAGGPSPFIATALFATFNSSFPIALYILLCGILGIVAPETRLAGANRPGAGAAAPALPRPTSVRRKSGQICRSSPTRWCIV
jgi:MFS family permease